MKYYSPYAEKYVQDICDAMDKAGYRKKKKSEEDESEPFKPDDFESLSQFLTDFVVMPIRSYHHLDELGLVNRGFCPYTGEKIDKSSPKWTYMRSRSIYVSNKGLEIMQQEGNERHYQLTGSLPKPRRTSILRKLIVFGARALVLYLIACIFSLDFSFQNWNWFSRIFFLVLLTWTFTDTFIHKTLD